MGELLRRPVQHDQKLLQFPLPFAKQFEFGGDLREVAPDPPLQVGLQVRIFARTPCFDREAHLPVDLLLCQRGDVDVVAAECCGELGREFVLPAVGLHPQGKLRSTLRLLVEEGCARGILRVRGVGSERHLSPLLLHVSRLGEKSRAQGRVAKRQLPDGDPVGRADLQVEARDAARAVGRPRYRQAPEGSVPVGTARRAPSSARTPGPWRRLPLMALLSGLAALNVYFWEPPANITAGTALAALALAVGAGRRWGRAECLLALSLMVPLVFPLGSNGGPQFFGQYVGFLPLPVALWVVARGLPATAGWHGPQWRTALGCAFAAVCAGLLLANARRPLMEDGTRAECRHTVCSPATRHIMTTGANARMYAYLQREAGARVPRGSYMMCNFSLPLISVLECRPYAVFSDVFTSERMNHAYIDTAYRRAGGGGRLPWLLLDRSTLTDGFADACRHLRQYAPYRLVWTDGRYELWKPLTGDREKGQSENLAAADCPKSEQGGEPS